MPTDVAPRAGTVVIAGTGRLLCDGVSAVLGEHGLQTHGTTAGSPSMLAREVTGVGATATRQVVLLVDPVEPEWVTVAKKLRAADHRLGLVVLAARPSYLLQRVWQQPLPDRRRALANGLLTVNSDPDSLVEAIRAAAQRPQDRSAFWLDGPRHPFAFHQTDSGRLADAVRQKPDLHRTLVLEGRGLSRPALARRLEVQPETVGERLSKLRDMPGARNDVELGREASELGLFVDLPAELQDEP